MILEFIDKIIDHSLLIYIQQIQKSDVCDGVYCQDSKSQIA